MFIFFYLVQKRTSGEKYWTDSSFLPNVYQFRADKPEGYMVWWSACMECS